MTKFQGLLLRNLKKTALVYFFPYFLFYKLILFYLHYQTHTVNIIIKIKMKKKRKKKLDYVNARTHILITHNYYTYSKFNNYIF